MQARCQLIAMRTFSLLAATIALTGCSKNTACYGLTDNEVLQSIQRAYASQRMTPEMARNSRLDKWRVIAVERFGSKGDDAFSGMIFRQDDGSLLSVRQFENCTYETSPDRKPSDLKDWANPLAPPRF
jgi:hypothetical protein